MIAKIINYFGSDGLLHILCSLILAALIAAFLPVWAAAAITLAIGIGKELIYDLLLHKGSPQWKDIFADIAGIAAAAVIAVLYIYC